MAVTFAAIGSTTGATGATASVTVGAAGTSAGATIVVAVDEFATTIGGSVGDTKGNTYTSTSGVFLNGASSNGFIRLFYAQNASALSSGNTISYTRQTSASALAMGALVVSGAAPAGFDASVLSSATGSATPYSGIAGGVQLLGAGVIGIVGCKSNGAPGVDSGHVWTQEAVPARASASLLIAIKPNLASNASSIMSGTASNTWAALFIGFDPPVNLAGVSAVGAVGTVSGSINASGIAAVSALGVVGAVSAGISPNLSAVSGVGQIGTMSTSESITLPAVSAIGSAAPLTGGISAPLVAVSGVGQVGTLSASEGVTLPPVSAVGHVGAATVEDDVSLVGVAGGGVVAQIGFGESPTLSGTSMVGTAASIMSAEVDATLAGVQGLGVAAQIGLGESTAIQAVSMVGSAGQVTVFIPPPAGSGNDQPGMIVDVGKMMNRRA